MDLAYIVMILLELGVVEPAEKAVREAIRSVSETDHFYDIMFALEKFNGKGKILAFLYEMNEKMKTLEEDDNLDLDDDLDYIIKSLAFMLLRCGDAQTAMTVLERVVDE